MNDKSKSILDYWIQIKAEQPKFFHKSLRAVAPGLRRGLTEMSVPRRIGISRLGLKKRLAIYEARSLSFSNEGSVSNG